MDKSGSTARPTRNKPGIRTFDADREQIVERAPVNGEDYVSTQRVRSAGVPYRPAELPMLFLFDSRFYSFLCGISSRPLRLKALPLQQVKRLM
jgi:hypothetical protein